MSKLTSVLESLRLESEESDSTLLPLEVAERADDGDPVEDVGEDGRVRRVIVPTKDGVEDHPTSVAGDLGVSVVDAVRLKEVW